MAAQRQAPSYLIVDNGSEFAGHLLDLQAYQGKARTHFSRLGKPTDNCYVETFNGSFCEECLNVHWFEAMEDADAIIEARRGDYNETRLHMALNGIVPEAYTRRSVAWNAENQLSNWSEKSGRFTGAIASRYDWFEKPRQLTSPDIAAYIR